MARDDPRLMQRGLSAYEVAMRYSHPISEAEWVRSLRGKDGLPGKDALPGKDGKPGLSIKGDPGLKGDMGPMPRHEWRGTELRFQQGPDGDNWGAWVDLKGPGGTTTVVSAGAAAPLSVVSWFPVVIL